MNIALYFFIFFIGTLVGSFLTLATYRIPLKQDITHKRSYCPNCNHKLGFWDLIPVFSYIFLGAKCRYCKKRISPRYFFIEILCGFMFLILAKTLDFNVYNGISVFKMMEFSIWALYIVFLFLIGQIDKERGNIEEGVLVYGFVISMIKVGVDYFLTKNELATYNLNRIILYLIFIIVLNFISIKNKNQNNYYISIMIVCAIMAIYTYEITTILSIICALLIIAIKELIYKMVNGKNRNIKQEKHKMPISFYLVTSNIIIILIAMFCK